MAYLDPVEIEAPDSPISVAIRPSTIASTLQVAGGRSCELRT